MTGQEHSHRGAAVFLVGLSGAGKTTIASLLEKMLVERYERTVSVLDGDAIRRTLSKGLGFSKEDRQTNLERNALVASEIAKHGGIAISAVIAAYADSREVVRRIVEEKGAYVEVYVATPLAVCESRDDKGLYKKARAGLVEHMSGVNDPFEPPEHPDITVDTSDNKPEEAAEKIVGFLAAHGIVRK